MTAIEQLGAQIARGTQGAQLAERIALHIGDTTAAWVAGARSDEGRALLAFGASLQGASMADRVLLFADGRVAEERRNSRRRPALELSW